MPIKSIFNKYFCLKKSVIFELSRRLKQYTISNITLFILTNSSFYLFRAKPTREPIFVLCQEVLFHWHSVTDTDSDRSIL